MTSTSIIFVDADGDRRILQAEPGQSVMQVATNNKVAAILAPCQPSNMPTGFDCRSRWNPDRAAETADLNGIQVS